MTKKQQYIYAGITIAVVLIIIAVIYYRRKMEKKQVISETTKYFMFDFPLEEAQKLAEIFERYFRWHEFDSPGVPGSGKANIKPKSMAKYVLAREFAQIPFKVNSAYRTPEHNTKVGGVPNSAHTRGYAFDTSTRRKDEKAMIKAFLRAGFNRVGVYNTFIHVDDDPQKPKNVAWQRFNSLDAVKNYIA